MPAQCLSDSTEEHSQTVAADFLHNLPVYFEPFDLGASRLDRRSVVGILAAIALPLDAIRYCIGQRFLLTYYHFGLNTIVLPFCLGE